MLWGPKSLGTAPAGQGNSSQKGQARQGGVWGADGQSGRWRLHGTTLTRGHVCHRAGNCPPSTLGPHDQQAEHGTKASNVLTRKREAAPVTGPPFPRSPMVTATPAPQREDPRGPTS